MATPSRCQPLFPALLVILLAGCEANHYEIELSPDGEGLRRALTVRKMRGDDEERPFDETELEAIAKPYGVPVPKERTKIPPFVARFTDRMPQDVGGAGWHVPLHSPLGSAYGYTERFRGTIDLVALVEQYNGNIDRSVNHLTAWLKAEVGGEPYAEKAAAALDTQLRRDLKNVVLYVLAGSVPMEDKNQGQNLGMRVGAFLAERAYFQPKELPALLRAFSDAQRGDESRLAEFAMRWLATQAGIALDQPLPERLKRLTNRDVLLASLRKYAETTPDYGKLLEKWETEKTSHPDKSRPDALDVFLPDLSIGHFVGSDHLELRLRTLTAPHTTNGTWSAEKKMVTWKKQPIAEAKSPHHWPTLCYAFWSEPNVKYQQARFGRVMLKDKELDNYCMWYAGLSAEERKEWDALLASEPAGDALLTRIEQFRFRGDPPYEPPRVPPKDDMDKKAPPPSLADGPRSLFKNAQEREKKEKEERKEKIDSG